MLSHPLQPKYTCKEWEPNLPPLCLPNPEYLAPEYILSVSCDSASDMYSLGVVMHAVFNEGKPVFQVNKHDIFKSFSRQLDQVSGGVPNLRAWQIKDSISLELGIDIRSCCQQMSSVGWRMSCSDLIWVVKWKYVWNNPDDGDLTHSRINENFCSVAQMCVIIITSKHWFYSPLFYSFSIFQPQLSTMSPAVLNKIPEEVREHVKMLLSVTPNVRPDADQMTKVCIVPTSMKIQRTAYFLQYELTLVIPYFVVWNSDSIFWRRGCHDPAVLWLPLPKGQPTEVPVLQRPPQSPAQTTQGSKTKCIPYIFKILIL